MGTHFSGYCSLYDTNYYNKFTIDKYALADSDGKRVPLVKKEGVDFSDPKSVIGVAYLTQTETGIRADCHSFIDVPIIEPDSHLALDAYIIKVTKESNNHVTNGTIQYVSLVTSFRCPMHDSIKEEKE